MKNKLITLEIERVSTVKERIIVAISFLLFTICSVAVMVLAFINSHPFLFLYGLINTVVWGALLKSTFERHERKKFVVKYFKVLKK